MNGRLELRVLSLPESKPAAYLQDAGSIINADFSPDCRWVAYQSEESGKSDIYVRAFPKAEANGS